MIIQMILTSPLDVDVRVFKEAKYLVSQGHDVEILWWDKSPEKNRPVTEKVDGFKIRRFRAASTPGTGYKQIFAYKKYISMVKSYLKGIDYDILHCHDMDGALCGKLSGVKFVFDMHEFYDKGGFLKKFVSHVLAKSLSKKAEANIYVGVSCRDTYGKGNVKPFYELKNYCDPSSFRTIEKTASEKFRISYIGVVRNQVPEFKALFDAVVGMDDVVVNVYGDGTDLEKLQKLQKNYDNVIVHGSYNGVEDSEQIYKNTDISFVAYDPSNPNYQNDFEPVKLYEAIFTRTPIIATESINPGKLAKEKDIGVAVDTRNPKKLRSAIVKLMNDKEFYDKCVENMKRISSQYDWSEAVKILDKIYPLIE